MLESVANIKTLLIEGSCNSQGYRRAKLVSTVKKFFGRHHHLVDPYNVAVLILISDLMVSVEA